MKDIAKLFSEYVGTIARGLIQNCDFGGSVKKFISIGGPHMGTYTVLKCLYGIGCNIINGIVRFSVYTGLAQNLIGAANYFKVANSYKSYLRSARYLPVINNEISPKNNTRKQRFANLEGVMLVMFTGDTVINPAQSAWFCDYDENMKLRDMTETPLYQEDYIGLKTLDSSGRLKRIKLYGEHLQYTSADIATKFAPFLTNQTTFE